MREAGLLEVKLARNPLKAERSPRGEFKGFSFDPPPSMPVAERWTYPDNDWGMMAKFSSQREIYEAIYQRERRQKEVEEQVRRIKEDNLKKINSELAKQREVFDAKVESRLALEKQYKQYEDALENPHKYAHQHSHHHLAADSEDLLAMQHALDQSLSGRHGASGTSKKQSSLSLDHLVDPNHDKVNRSSVAALRQSTFANLRALEKELLQKDALTEFKVSSIKTLEGSHPNIMKKVRSERALQYINSLQAKGLDGIPRPQALPKNGSFHPPGVASAERRSKRHGHVLQRPHSSADVAVDVLAAELHATENQMQRQKLKIGLQGVAGKHYAATTSLRG